MMWCVKEYAGLFGGKTSDSSGSEASFCRLDKDQTSMLSENQSMRNSSLGVIFHSGLIGHGLCPTSHQEPQSVAHSSVSSLRV